MALAVIGLMAAALVHYLYGGIRLSVSRDRLSGAAQVHFSALLGVFVLAKGADYWLDRFDLVTGSGSCSPAWATPTTTPCCRPRRSSPGSR